MGFDSQARPVVLQGAVVRIDVVIERRRGEEGIAALERERRASQLW